MMIIYVTTLLFLCTFGAEAESHNKRVMFGSCNNQLKDQSVFDIASQFNPDVFLWTGDIVYPTCQSFSCVERAYYVHSQSEKYEAFRKKVPVIDGVYDDHDYGENDGGSDYPNRLESKELLLRYLNVTSTDPRWSREGAYHSMIVKSDIESSRSIRVIFLDTRYFRDPHYWTSSFIHVGRFVLRTLAGFFGVGYDYGGDILGETQWIWLENELFESKTTNEAVILVSSIQVLTTMPLFESWGHFPRAKKRLFDLLKKIQPPGLIIVSGDVHFAEFSGSTSSRVFEVTSSGLTHHGGGTNFFRGILARVALNWPFGNLARMPISDILKAGDDSNLVNGKGGLDKKPLIKDGRRQDLKDNVSLTQSGYFIGRNFGIFDFTFDYDLENNENVLFVDVSLINVEKKGKDSIALPRIVVSKSEHAKNWELINEWLSKTPTTVRNPFSFEVFVAVIFTAIWLFCFTYIGGLMTYLWSKWVFLSFWLFYKGKNRQSLNDDDLDVVSGNGSMQLSYLDENEFMD